MLLSLFQDTSRNRQPQATFIPRRLDLLSNRKPSIAEDHRKGTRGDRPAPVRETQGRAESVSGGFFYQRQVKGFAQRLNKGFILANGFAGAIG